MEAPSATTQPVPQSTSAETPPGSYILRELTPTTCGIGAWSLRVVGPKVVEYTYHWQGQTRQGKKLECILLSEDSNSYCMGLVKRHGSNAAAEQNFNNFVTKFREDTVWSMSRITLANQNTQFISSPVKHVVDLTKTKVSAVLQSTSFPKIPTPPENLATVLRLPRQQK